MPRQKKQKLLGGGLKADLLKEFIDLSYKGNTSIAPEGYEIDTPLSDSRVKVYKKIGSNQVIVTHRGSVGLQDWLDNAKFLVAGKVKSTKTYKIHREKHLKAVEKYGAENIIGIGHSRAGLYLQELQKEVPIKEIITYNKAVGFYDALRENPSEQTDVKVKNDFVSLLSGLQKRPKKMVEIEATKNPLDFNKAHQPAELEKLGDQFIGLEDKIEGGKLTNSFYTPLPIVAVDFVGRKTGLFGSGTAPKTKSVEELKKSLTKLEKQRDAIKKGKVYKTTNIDKVNYEISYIEARLLHYATKGEDLIITKKKKYGDELPRKAKAYKPKEVKPKAVKPEPKKEEPKKEEPKKEEPKKEEPKKEEPKKEEPKKKEELKKSKYKYEDIIEELDTSSFPIMVYQSKELKPWITWIEKLLTNKNKQNSIIRPQLYLANEQAKQLLNEMVDYWSNSVGVHATKIIELIDNGTKNLIEYLGYEGDQYGDISLYYKPLNASNRKILAQVFKDAKVDVFKEEPKKEEPKKEEPKKEPKKEEPKKEEPKKEEPKPKKESQPWSQSGICKKIMCAYGLRTKAQYKAWIVKNHPDKGGKINNDDLIKILECANSKMYCKGKQEPKMKVVELEPPQPLRLTYKEVKEESLKKFLENIKPEFFGEDIYYKILKKLFKYKGEEVDLVDIDDELINNTLIPLILSNVAKKPEKEKDVRNFLLNPKNYAVKEPRKKRAKKMEGGIFGWSNEEKEAKKAKKEAWREEKKAKLNAEKKARDERIGEALEKVSNIIKKNRVKQEAETSPKAEEDAVQQGITETETEPMTGGGFYYLDEIRDPINPIYIARHNESIPHYVEPETEFLDSTNLIGGSAMDMLGMNCYDGKCFNPVWEKQKIKRQILSEYKIWSWPWGPVPEGHIRMPWLNAMIEERYKPLYDEFVAKRNVNIGLPADATKDQFGKQMFSNLTDALSYVPGSNVASAALTVASALSDTKS